ncbi:NADAR family protein [Myceligenerans pegani]|uniref:NADAR family protein n=1 Tax=Myceligenerans pegani TaxID=2776917 RepID=A0ABR9N0S7_9MICO|nr:NADAR family protein [Myceligenerans sp. TRM 65318]MBE1876607.1 NADAR family protein [Myceligenerans sp. TRM 65318]MBE3018878.1 NADAR family protein [Myceligenerans sp. TRM 65318]
MVGRRTSREVDGQTISGVTRIAFIRNGGTYFVTDLVIYADGIIDCWGLVDLEEFERKVASGWVATTLEEGAHASAHHVGSWTFAQPRSWVTPEGLIGEVRDQVDSLAGRPDSTSRCRAAIGAFLDDPTTARRRALLDAYLAVPEHLRVYMLGDMDNKDWPVQALAVGVGKKRPRDGARVTKELYEHALRYFERRSEYAPEWLRPKATRIKTSELVTPVQVPAAVYPQGVETAPAIHRLRNSFPCEIRAAGHVFDNVETAWHALSVADDEARARIAAAPSPYDAKKLAGALDKRDGWDEAREAVMHSLLSAKFMRHPDLADILLSTGTAPIHYDDFDRHWSTGGRNWIGRLLELVRSELRAQAAGLTDLVDHAS